MNRPGSRPGGPPLIATKRGRELVLCAAVVTMVVEMASLALGITIPFGNLLLSASALPMVAIVGLLGTRGVGRTRDVERVVPFWIAMAAGLGLGLALFGRDGNALDVLGLLIAATNEEVVYRFAVPLVITAALMTIRIPVVPARVVGYVAAGTWWVLLPGHQAQTQTIADLGTYVTFAIISALVVSRSRGLLPMSVAHCVLNVLTFSYALGYITSGSRMALTGLLLFLLVGTFAWPDSRVVPSTASDEGDDLISDTVIDLRDDRRPSVSHDGEVTWLDDPVPGAEPEESPALGPPRDDLGAHRT